MIYAGIALVFLFAAVGWAWLIATLPAHGKHHRPRRRWRLVYWTQGPGAR